MKDTLEEIKLLEFSLNRKITKEIKIAASQFKTSLYDEENKD